MPVIQQMGIVFVNRAIHVKNWMQMGHHRPFGKERLKIVFSHAYQDIMVLIVKIVVNAKMTLFAILWMGNAFVHKVLLEQSAKSDATR